MPKDIAELKQELAELDRYEKKLEQQRAKWDETRETERLILEAEARIRGHRRFIGDMGEKPEEMTDDRQDHTDQPRRGSA